MTGVGLSVSGHRAPFVKDQKLQEFGETLGKTVASALVALFNIGCCLLTTVSGTVGGDQGEHSLFAADGRGSTTTCAFCDKMMCPWTGDLSSFFLQSLPTLNCQSRKVMGRVGRAGTSVLGGPGAFF